MTLDPKAYVAAAALVALAVLPPIALALDQDFYVDMFTRIMIFAIAAVSLDLILGYGGLVSFGHAAYLGIGSYAVGILAYHGVNDGFLQFGVAILASALVALFVGWVSLRTSGVYFIMITLAFGQMIYFLGESINQYGGDNGLNISQQIVRAHGGSIWAENRTSPRPVSVASGTVPAADEETAPVPKGEQTFACGAKERHSWGARFVIRLPACAARQ